MRHAPAALCFAAASLAGGAASAATPAEAPKPVRVEICVADSPEFDAVAAALRAEAGRLSGPRGVSVRVTQVEHVTFGGSVPPSVSVGLSAGEPLRILFFDPQASVDDVAHWSVETAAEILTPPADPEPQA